MRLYRVSLYVLGFGVWLAASSFRPSHEQPAKMHSLRAAGSPSRRPASALTSHRLNPPQTCRGLWVGRLSTCGGHVTWWTVWYTAASVTPYVLSRRRAGAQVVASRTGSGSPPSASTFRSGSELGSAFTNCQSRQALRGLGLGSEGHGGAHNTPTRHCFKTVCISSQSRTVGEGTYERAAFFQGPEDRSPLSCAP